MTRQPTALLATLALLLTAHHACAIGTAIEVLSYSPVGTIPAGYDNDSAALGSPERFTGEGVFPGVVSPFSPPFLTTEIVSVGEGGHITLRLSNQIIPDPTGPELGVFTNTGIIVAGFPDVAAGPAPVGTFGADEAVLEVSDDGVNWVGLGQRVFDIPTSGYTDLTDPFSAVPGSAPSAFDLPFTGVLDDFAGLRYSDPGGTDILDVLNGSGGGTWVDLSSTGLTQVSFVRFSVADDSDPNTSLNFELDAVTISQSSLGIRTPEPSAVLLAACALPLWFGRRRS